MHDIYAWVICIEAISNTSNWMFHIYAGNAWHLRWVICIEARPCASLSFALTFPCWHPTFRRPKIWFIMLQNMEDSYSGDVNSWFTKLQEGWTMTFMYYFPFVMAFSEYLLMNTSLIDFAFTWKFCWNIQSLTKC